MASGHTRTWVLVADSARARAVHWEGRAAPLKSVEGFDLRYHHEHGREIMSERPCRPHESQGTTRHAIELPVDPVREAERRFIEKAVQELKDRFVRNEFDHLVLVAGPTVLGDLRATVPENIRAFVRGELDKDLTHLTNAQLKEHLQGGEIL
jgi:protein required for attachment to host cells